MNWSEEFWIKLYRRASPSFLAMSFEARGLFRLLLTEVEPSTGELELGRLGLKAVAVAIRTDWPRIKDAIQECLDDGCLQVSSDGRKLTIGNFVEAQGAVQTGASRMRKLRSRRDETSPKSDGTSPNHDAVSPKRDAVTHTVTRGDECDDQIRSDQKRTDPSGGSEQVTPPPLKLVPDKPKATQKSLPGVGKPAPSLLTPAAWGVWREKYRESYGTDYIDEPGDNKVLASLIAAAKSAASQIRPDDSEASLALLTHWLSAYLRDEAAYLAQHKHPLRSAMKDLNKYGTPWANGRNVTVPQHKPLNGKAKQMSQAELASASEAGRKACEVLKGL